MSALFTHLYKIIKIYEIKDIICKYIHLLFVQDLQIYII